jgi:hypothetical protein
MTFSTQALVGQRVLVRGTDNFGVDGSTVVSSAQWDDVNAHRQADAAGAEFDAAVEAFFAPLTAAADALKNNVSKPEDSASFVVLHEGTEPVVGEEAHVVRLNRDSIILRLIEQGDTSRLVWVDGELEILEVPPAPVAPSVGTEDLGGL